jgi:hypothetical protein
MTAGAAINGTGAGLHQYHQAMTASGTVTGNKISNISATSPAWGTFMMLLGPAYDPTVTLNWTATTDTYATGYAVTRTPGSLTAVGGQSTATWTDTTTAAVAGYTYDVSSVFGLWDSSVASVSVSAC